MRTKINKNPKAEERRKQRIELDGRLANIDCKDIHSNPYRKSKAQDYWSKGWLLNEQKKHKEGFYKGRYAL